MCSHVTDWNKTASVKFRLDVDFSCKLGFDLDLKHLSPNDLAYCQAAIKEYNRLKPIIFAPNLYRLVSPYETNHCALMRVNDEKTHAYSLLTTCIRGITKPSSTPVCKV